MEHDIDLLIVNPNSRVQIVSQSGFPLSGLEPPLWCAMIAAYIRQCGYSVRILDAEAENLSAEDTARRIAELNPFLTYIEVLGLNPSATSTPKMSSTGEVLKALSKFNKGTKTMLGGIHPSALPERTLREESVDFVCRGEGFYTNLELLKVLKSGKTTDEYKIQGLWHLRNGEVKANPPAPLMNLDDLPIAAWDLLPMDKYRAHNWHCFAHLDQRKPYGVVYTSVGCPFDCSYCNIHALYNDKPKIRFYTPSRVVEEIDLLVNKYSVRNIKFLDELFALDEERVTRICDLIIKRGYDLNIWAYARVDTVNERMMKKMKQAGINWLCYGFESASTEVRKGVAKKFKQDEMERAVKVTYDAGIHIIANFIFGLPDDNLETMQETLNTAKRFNFEYVNFYTAMAYPGSQLYEDALKQGIELPQKWHGYGQYSEETLPLPTKYLSAAEVLRFRDKTFKEYLSRPEYLNVINEKFGPGIVEHIKDMLKYEMKRKFA